MFEILHKLYFSDCIWGEDSYNWLLFATKRLSSALSQLFFLHLICQSRKKLVLCYWSKSHK